MHGIWQVRQYQQQRWPSQDYNHPIAVKGTITNLPHLKNHAIQFWLHTRSGIIQLNWYRPFPEHLSPGDAWQLSVKIKPNNFANNPGEFDYGKYLKQHGVLATGYVMTKPAAKLLTQHPWHYPLQSLRAYVYQRIISATNSLNMQGVLVALILGDKSLLNAHQQQVFEESGTSYFMVISGLHIVLFAMLSGLIARYCWCLIPGAALKIPAPKIGLLVGLFFGLLYSLLAGFLIPTQRALWMLWLMGLAKLFYERINTMQLLILAFLIVVAWDPLSLYSVAFWLSFIAVFFLIYIMSARYHKLTRLEEWIYPQWVMYMALMPVLIFVFHLFSFVSLLTNFIAIPFMMFGVIPLALLGGVLVMINFQIGQLLFSASDGLMRLLFSFLNWGVHLPHALILFPQLSLLKVLLALAGCLILFSPRGVPLRISGILLLLPLLFPKPLLEMNEVKTTHLKVTEGNVTIVQTQNYVIVEQTVIHLPEAKTAIYSAIMPYLNSQGVNHIDIWIVNNLKNYHALLSLQHSFQGLPIHQIIVPHVFTVFDSFVKSCTPPQPLTLEQQKFVIQLNRGICSIVPFV